MTDYSQAENRPWLLLADVWPYITLLFCSSGIIVYKVPTHGIYMSSVPTHFFICGFVYPLSIKSAGMKLNFEGIR